MRDALITVCVGVIAYNVGQLVQWVKNARRRDKRGD